MSCKAQDDSSGVESLCLSLGRISNFDDYALAQDDPRWNLADPICTFLFAILVLLTTRLLLRDISDILMERVPRGQNAQAIQEELEQVCSTPPVLHYAVPCSF